MSRPRALLILALLFAADGCDEPAAPGAPEPERSEVAAQSERPAPAPEPGMPSREGFEQRWGRWLEIVRVDRERRRYELRATAAYSDYIALRDPRTSMVRAHSWIAVGEGARELPPQGPDLQVSVGDTILLTVPVESPPLEWASHDPGSSRHRGRVVLGPVRSSDGDAARIAREAAPHFGNARRAAWEGRETHVVLVRLEALSPGVAPVRGTETRVLQPGEAFTIEHRLGSSRSQIGPFRPGDVYWVGLPSDDPLGSALDDL